MENNLQQSLKIPLTDLGNAERFKLIHKTKAIFIEKMGKWHIYDGMKWVVDSGANIIQMAKLLLRSCYESTEDKDVRKHFRKSESNSKIQAMLKLAQSELATSPDLLDKDPMLFNVINGTIDLRTGVLRPHDSSDLITKISNITCDPNADCPIFKKFISEIMDSNEQMISYLKRVVGYSMTGLTKEQALFVLYGDGSNGKSTFIDVLKKIIGDYSATSDISTFTYKQSDQIRNDLARLFDARVVTSVEIQEGKFLDESVIKQVTGGDPVACRFLFKEHFEYIPKWKLFLVVNHLPHISGTDRGIWRRLRPVHFGVSFENGRKDKDLPAKLETEMPGILNWAIEGCLDWQRQGLADPDQIFAAVDNYRQDEDSLEEFINEKLFRNENYKTSASILFQAYADYQRQLGQKTMSQKTFGQRLAIKGFTKFRGQGGRYYYCGLSTVDETRF